MAHISDFSHRRNSVLLEHKFLFVPTELKITLQRLLLRPVILAKAKIHFNFIQIFIHLYVPLIFSAVMEIDVYRLPSYNVYGAKIWEQQQS